MDDGHGGYLLTPLPHPPPQGGRDGWGYFFISCQMAKLNYLLLVFSDL